MNATDQKIHANIEARKQAELMISLMIEAGAECADRVLYFQNLRQLFDELSPPPKTRPATRLATPEPPPATFTELMTDEESREFGGHQIGFGKHAGARIDEVPLAYLKWLAGQITTTAFGSNLAYYLASNRITSEQGGQ